MNAIRFGFSAAAAALGALTPTVHAQLVSDPILIHSGPEFAFVAETAIAVSSTNSQRAIAAWMVFQYDS
jgi:hypothetical protein